MIEAALRDNYSMLRASERLIDLYQKGLLPKSRQDIEQALTGYSTGRVDAVSIISRLKTLLDYESLYWGQRVEREKAIARLHAITAGQSVRRRKKDENKKWPPDKITGSADARDVCCSLLRRRLRLRIIHNMLGLSTKADKAKPSASQQNQAGVGIHSGCPASGNFSGTAETHWSKNSQSRCCCR